MSSVVEQAKKVFEKELDEATKTILDRWEEHVDKIGIEEKGGPGSGFRGHTGLTGVHGGSTPRGSGGGGKFNKNHFVSGKERDVRRSKGIYDVISETDVETAKILLTQGIEPSFKPQIPGVTFFQPGRGLERDGLYVANSEAFSKGSFGRVRLYMTTKKGKLKSPQEMRQLGRKDVDDVLGTVNGAVTLGQLPKSVFQRVEVSKGGKWIEMTPKQFLESVGITSEIPILPTVPVYKKWLEKNVDLFNLTSRQIDDIAHDYNRGSLEDKLWLAEEAGLLK